MDWIGWVGLDWLDWVGWNGLVVLGRLDLMLKLGFMNLDWIGKNALDGLDSQMCDGCTDKTIHQQ